MPYKFITDEKKVYGNMQTLISSECCVNLNLRSVFQRGSRDGLMVSMVDCGPTGRGSNKRTIDFPPSGKALHVQPCLCL